MLAQIDRYDTVANNLVNVNTPGFKRQDAVTTAFPTMLLSRIRDARDVTPPVIGTLGTGALVSETVTRFTAGTSEETGNPFDLAIDGTGYFAITTPEGVRYTRNGSFRSDATNRLVTQEGYVVQGTNGTSVDVSKGLDPKQVRVATPADADLDRAGDNLFRLAAGKSESTTAQAGSVATQRLETANVDQATAVVEMMSALRAYEASQKVIQAMDETLGKAVTEIARQ
jgi:flagellar basal-body rod protein FlgG